MFFGKKKTKEEKIIEQMKEKKEQIDKLKEEMNNMAKLVLKDGKLQKVEDVQKQEEKKEINTPPSPPPELDTRRAMPQQYQEDIFENPRRQPTPDEVQQIRQQIINENRAKQEYQLRQEQMRLYQEQEQMRMMQQQAAQQQAQQFVPPPTPPQQFYQQPVPPIQSVVVVIEMVNGSIYKYEITTDVLNQFTSELNAAMNQQTTYSLNDRTIHGKHIVSYFIE